MNILDKTAHEQLETNGYVVLNALDDAEIKLALDLLHPLKEECIYRRGVHITFNQTLDERFKNLSQALISAYTPIIQKIIAGARLFQGSFIIKSPQSEVSVVPAHQDWTFVDEAQGQESFNLWIMLSDTEDDTGAIGFVPESHKSINQIRYAPESAFEGLRTINEQCPEERFVFHHLKKGQAILWNNKTVHMSYPNQSAESRIVLSFGLCGEKDQMKLFWKSPEKDAVLECNVPNDFYLHNNSLTLEEAFQKNILPPLANVVKEHHDKVLGSFVYFPSKAQTSALLKDVLQQILSKYTALLLKLKETQFFCSEDIGADAALSLQYTLYVLKNVGEAGEQIQYLKELATACYAHDLTSFKQPIQVTTLALVYLYQNRAFSEDLQQQIKQTIARQTSPAELLLPSKHSLLRHPFEYFRLCKKSNESAQYLQTHPTESIKNLCNWLLLPISDQQKKQVADQISQTFGALVKSSLGESHLFDLAFNILMAAEISGIEKSAVISDFETFISNQIDFLNFSELNIAYIICSYPDRNHLLLKALAKKIVAIWELHSNHLAEENRSFRGDSIILPYLSFAIAIRVITEILVCESSFSGCEASQ